MRRSKLGLLLALCGQPLFACAGPGGEANEAARKGVTVQDQPSARPVSGLPYSEGRTFYSLDEYLAFLRKAGEYDTPWYRKVGPDRYELAGRRFPGSAPAYVTREELMRKFGFDR